MALYIYIYIYIYLYSCSISQHMKVWSPELFNHLWNRLKDYGWWGIIQISPVKRLSSILLLWLRSTEHLSYTLQIHSAANNDQSEMIESWGLAEDSVTQKTYNSATIKATKPSEPEHQKNASRILTLCFCLNRCNPCAASQPRQVFFVRMPQACDKMWQNHTKPTSTPEAPSHLKHLSRAFYSILQHRTAS